MSYAQTFLNETDVIWEKGYCVVRLCRLAGISRRTLYRARKNPSEITIDVADRIIHALRKMPHIPYEFRKKSGQRFTPNVLRGSINK